MAPTTAAASGSILAIELIPDIRQPFPTLDPTSVNVTILPNGANFAEECGILPPTFGQFLNLFEVFAVLPASLPLGPAQLIFYHSGLTVTAPITIVPLSPGLFPPTAAFAVQQMGSGQVRQPNQLTHPAQPGDTVTLWGTGLRSAPVVTVLLGGIATTASAVGPAPGMPGVDQIQFVVPDNPAIPNDCYVAVAVQTPGFKSNTISFSKTSDGSACQSALGLTTADLATLDAGGTVGLAQLSVEAVIRQPLFLERQGNLSPGLLANGNSTGFTRTEFADFMPIGQNAAGVAEISGLAVADEAFFGCTTSSAESLAIGLLAFNNSYDFGSSLTLTGSGGSLNLTAPFSGSILFSGAVSSPAAADPSQLTPPLFTVGTGTFSGKGGMGSPGIAAAASFSVPLTLPPEIMATNFSALQTIHRSRDLLVMWNPAGFGAQDVLTVRVSGAGTLFPSSLSRLDVPSPLVMCKIPASGGQIVIPAAMLQNLPPTTTGGPPTTSINLEVSQRSGHAQTFSLPLSDGTSLPGVLQFTSSETWPVMVE